jgi:phosphate transport system substrate-binding protein
MGGELTPALVQAFLRQKSITNVAIGPRIGNEILVTGRSSSQTKPVDVEIRLDGTSRGFTDLEAGSTDIGMSSRGINADEVRILGGLGDMTSREREHVVGLDGIAVIVNPSNPVEALTTDQVRSLFSGETGDWQGITGAAQAVKTFARAQDSGTTESFLRLVMASVALPASTTYVESQRDVADRVAQEKGGIGFVALPYAGSAKVVRVGEPGASALLPTAFTIATQDYALSRRLYFYSGARTQPLAEEFLKFALGPSGQKIVEDIGFVSQTIRENTTFVPVNPTPAYTARTRGARRLNTDLRFHTGRSDLDAKAWDDLDRVLDFLSAQGYEGRNLLLLGFADNTGSKAINQKLSRDRAESASLGFAEREVEVKNFEGFGSDMPVASNGTAEGREKNRRVEIWVRK